MSRMKIEGLLSAFSKLVTSGKGKQHTYVETDSIRFLFHPFDEVYLVLTTNKGSNIVDDLETLSLLSKVVMQYGASYELGLTEESVKEFAFSIIFAMDEAIGAGGHAEHLTMPELQEYLEMYSHEEETAISIRRQQEQEAAIRAAKHAEEMSKRGQQSGGPSRGKYGGVGSSGASTEMPSLPRTGTSDTRPSYMAGDGMGSSMAGVGSGSSGGYGASGYEDSVGGGGGRGSTTLGGARKGTKLGGTKLGGRGGPASGRGAGDKMSAAAMEALAQEGLGHLVASGAAGAAGGGGGAGAEAEDAVEAAKRAAAAAAANQVVCGVKEKMTVRMDRDGGCSRFEIKGTLSVTCQVPEASTLRLQTQLLELHKDVQFTTHPNLDKAAFSSSGQLVPRKAMPVGRPASLLRWKYTSKDVGDVPITLTCWADEGDGSSEVTVDWEFQPGGRAPSGLRNVQIIIPLQGASGQAPKVTSCDGVWQHSPSEDALVWTVGAVTADNPNGSMLFTATGDDADMFFPITVQFECLDALGGLEVVGAADAEGNGLRMGLERTSGVEEFIIE